MKTLNYDVEDKQSERNSHSSQGKSHSCLTGALECFFNCGPSGSGKTNLLLDMIYRLLYFDKIYL